MFLSDKGEEIALREAAVLNGSLGTRGYRRCHCKMKRTSYKCACHGTSKLCNSKCHRTFSRRNK